MSLKFSLSLWDFKLYFISDCIDSFNSSTVNISSFRGNAPKVFWLRHCLKFPLFSWGTFISEYILEWNPLEFGCFGRGRKVFSSFSEHVFDREDPFVSPCEILNYLTYSWWRSAANTYFFWGFISYSLKNLFIICDCPWVEYKLQLWRLFFEWWGCSCCKRWSFFD